MVSKFTHFHVHSHYSLLDGLPKIPDLVAHVKKLGMDAVAVTDHGVLYGAVEFFKEGKKQGIKPIIGCELYMAYEDMDQKRPRIDDKRYHLVLLAKNKKGYENLVHLVTQAHLEGFYYKPRIDDNLLAKHAEGLIALSACIQGKIPQLIIANRFEEAEKKALEYQELFGEGNFYLEIQHHPSLAGQIKANPQLIKIAKKHGIPLVATNDSHYLNPEDKEAQDVLLLINTGSDKDDPARLTMLSDDYSVPPPEKMAESFKHIPEAITNTEKIKDACNFEFELGKIILPKFEPPKGTSVEYLKKLCEQGIKKRYADSLPKDLEARLKEELSVIENMGFCDYFLIVQDFVRWAKEQNIAVGPARGSVAGSLVSYLTGITEVDPLKYDLIFERFLNKDRVSMPDIDLDFADTRRDEVIEYVQEKYGKDKVAQIITFGTMAARAVIRDVGRALGYSYDYCDKMAKMVPFGFSLEQCLAGVQEFSQLYEQDERASALIDFAKKLEGVARHASTHACAIVISREPLEKIVPLQYSSQNDKTIITQYDMYSIEDIGLLKMDFLGLKNLTTIEETIALIKERRGEDIDIEKLPFDDAPTFELMQKAKTTSVFQLESSGMKNYLKALKPTQLEDIIAMVALYRPGPMEFIPKFIRRKHGEESVEYLHPKLEPILKDTYGICVFQEQLMRIATDIAGFTLPEADILRKAVGKKIKTLLDKQKVKFLEGAIKNDVSRDTAQRLWQWILPFARYGFNKAHATAYAMIAYQTAYLKTHYPLEFMTGVLVSEKADIERTAVLIEECKSMGINVLRPDINESEEKFTAVGENSIRFGLSAIKNVGKSAVEQIVSERKAGGAFKSISDFALRVSGAALNKKTMESMVKAGTFDKLDERQKLLDGMPYLLKWARRQQSFEAQGQRSLFSAGGKSVQAPEIKLEEVPPARKAEKLKWEKELLGLYVTSHPLEPFTKLFKEKALPIQQLGKCIQKRVRIGGIVSGIRKILTKNGDPMMFATLEDKTGKIDVVVFPGALKKNGHSLEQDKIVFMSGKVDDRKGRTQLICDNVEEIVDSK